MGDLDQHFQGHLAVQGLKLTQCDSCNATTQKAFCEIRPKLHYRYTEYEQGFKPDYIMDHIELYFQGHLGVQVLKLTRFCRCNAITQKLFCKTGPNLGRICILRGFKSG